MMNPKEETHLEDVLPRSTRGGAVENVLKEFFATHIPLSVEMQKMQKSGNREEALKMMKNNMNKLIDECFFVLHSIITCALKGILKIETIEEVQLYHLIYVWFIPVCEVERRRKGASTYCEGANGAELDEQKRKGSGRTMITEVERRFPFGGVYLSEWIITGINKALSMILCGSGSQQVSLGNWSFVLDLIKFVYAEGDILSKYLRGGVVRQGENARPTDSGTHMEKRNSNVKAIDDRENHMDTALEKYHAEIHNIIKAYFSLPFVLFKCITDIGVKKGEDEKRKLYIYQHIIPGELNDEGFSKQAVKTCVFFWLHGGEGTVNYEKMAVLTKRLVNCHLVNPFCQTLLAGLLLVSGSDKAADVGGSSEDALTLTRMSDLLQNLFYYVHLYCHGEFVGQKLLTCLIENINPFVKVVQNEEKLSLCLFNRTVKHLLSVIIKLFFLYKWDFYILEKFFSIFSRNCLPLSFSLTFIELIGDLVGPNWTVSNLPFVDFTHEKKTINSSEVIREKKSYRAVVRQLKGEENQSTYWCVTNCSMDERNMVGIMAFEFLKEMFFFVLGQFSPDSQEKDSSTFVPIILSKLLYTFSIHMNFLNKKLVESSYHFEALSEVELHIYKFNSHNSVKIFERITTMVRELFKRKDEVSLIGGQILADHFRLYVDGLSYKEEKKHSQTDEKMGNCENCREGDSLFPILQEPEERFPEELRCFKVIKQNGFVYLDDLICTSDPELCSEVVKMGEKLDDELDDELGDKSNDKIDGLVVTLREPLPDEGKKKREDDMLIRNADSLIDNELYNMKEKQFLVELELENEFYLNVDRNKEMYIDPPGDLFECLHRMKNRANYIERNDQEINYDHLKLSDTKETYDEENFRISQAVVSLPRFIRKGDVLTYLCVELYEALLSLNHVSCLLREGKSSFTAIKLFDMILLTINAPIEICNFVFKNIYSNIYSNVQKMVMLLCLQLCVMFLSGRATLREVFQSAREVTAQIWLNEGDTRRLEHQTDLENMSDKFYHLTENFPSDDGNVTISDDVAVHVSSEREGGQLLFDANGANGEEEEPLPSGRTEWERNTHLLHKPNMDRHDKSKICDLRKKRKSNNALLKRKQASQMSLQNSGKKNKSMSTLCSFFFPSAYTKLLNVNIKKEDSKMEYDEYKLKKYYSNEASLVLSLISTYMVFFISSCNCNLSIDDILTDGFTLANFYIRNKNSLIRRVSFKLLFHMINFILKKKKFYLLEHANYMDVISYMSENVCFDQDGPSVQLMQCILGVHKVLVGESIPRK
ncbi:conserved Plasmodium protein, unknown function [Plasmodium knowlesi strain H]|uniref:Telomere length regulation protein conserved domain-containing protein n=3 Tax=Plasmodium knowlesi TaxID=5850 RepID=A0A5K1V5B0_PLAKH|nr:conserved Plasmodium protein, unknown function [Plasmodium knowlesi strain H]OTN67228.1 Uncharacterized protein PKNOH_S06406400 [Plasmodium knowlesi]CAA9987339.1 conserved Plasmodium protein, unknown function [Plasmodium knowlesi strain H]SBO23378.1 conserved Plasmodium protein, unknown function [Plasmodium knowlesi strain H]SBO24589.1 conserved Plasmodium protein, unknown function [Plasmodium knowlesi strain H]VVS76813.1 conserved Plasmodium protein, unknown function [Plasmodium knowlesi s|eukprot:XP_002258342.1 hypothetical protein, conserved in Plasmodium species [Plasmodium knowlesi strain H]